MSCCKDGGRTQQTHEPHCRERSMSELMKTAAGQALVDKDERRKAKGLRGSADFEGR